VKNIDRIIFDAEVSEKKILLLPINTIIATPYNPPSRTKPGKALEKLSAAIAKVGLIQPILITSDRDLVDGNRRLAAAKKAGLTHIECLIIPDGVDKDECFCVVNTTAEKINGKGWLQACRYGYKKAPKEIQSKYDELFKSVGTYGIDMLIEKRIGIGVLDLCKNAKSIGLSIRLNELIIKVVQGKLTNKVNAIVRANLSQADRLQKLEELLT